MGLVWIERFNSLDNVICTEIKDRQFLFSFKRYIWWNKTVTIYCRTLLTKLLLNKFVFTKKSVTSWFPTSNAGINGTSVFSIFQ